MWLPLILATAFFTSLQDVFGKKVIHRVDPHIVAWAWVFFSLPLLGVLVWIEGIPPLNPTFWAALIISSVILVIGAIFYFKAIKYSDLSLAVPMLTFTPVFLLATSPFILGEFPSPFGILGILLIVTGAYVLHLRECEGGFWEPFKNLVREKGSRYMLLVALLFSISANLDKVGVINSSPNMWIFSLHIVLSIALGGIMFRQTTKVYQQVRESWPYLFAVGLTCGLALVFQMAAIKMTMIPYLIAVKRTSVFMTSLFGFFLFKERGMKERLIGTILMVLGVFMIAVFQ